MLYNIVTAETYNLYIQCKCGMMHDDKKLAEEVEQSCSTKPGLLTLSSVTKVTS